VVSLATVVVRQTVPERLKNPLTVRASVAGLCRREIGLTFGWRPGICPCGPCQPPQSRSQCPPVRRVLSAWLRTRCVGSAIGGSRCCVSGGI